MKQNLLLLIGLILIVASCRESIPETSEVIGNSTGSGGGTTVTLNSSVSGNVESSSVTASSSSAGLNVLTEDELLFASAGNECAYSPYKVYKVGGGGAVISEGFASNGTFTANVNLDHEVIIDFSCGIRCFGKPQSSDLICDTIATSVVSALEISLNATVEGSSLYDGLSVAKIAEGIVETIKLMSKLDPTTNIVDKLIDANELGGSAAKTKMAEIILASNVGSLFSSMETLANQAKAKNEALNAGKTEAQAEDDAAKSAWDVEKVIAMLTGLGIEAEVEIDDDGFGLYSDIFTQIDTWANTTFVADFRVYALSLFDQLYVTNSTSSTTLLCQASIESNDGPEQDINYPPYKINDGTSDVLTCMHADASSDTDAMGVTTSSGTALANNVRRVKLLIKQSFDEVNRNDPLGQFEQHRDIDNYRVDFIDIFQEFMTAIDSGGVCSAFVVMDASSDGPEEFLTGFETCVSDNGLDRYFSGLIGIYKFMRNSDLRAAKFSLNELYDTMVNSEFMGITIGMDIWELGLNNGSINIDFTDTGHEDWSEWVSRYLLEETSVTNGNATYDLICPENGVNGAYTHDFCDNGDATPDSLSMSGADYLAIASTFQPSYASTLEMFETIPTMTEVKDFIFKNAHHVPYNLAGSKKFGVIGANTGVSANEWEGDTPVLCNIINANAVGDFVSGTSQISCELANANGINWDSDGKAVYPTGYENYYQNYYALQARSGNSGQGDSLMFYGLVNLSNGTEYRVNGRNLRILGVISDNPTLAQQYGVPDASHDGSSIFFLNKEFCNTWQDSDGSVKTDCWQEQFDYIVIDISSDVGIFRTDYSPYTWDITIGEDWWLRSAVYSDATGDWAVCLPDANVTIDANDFALVTNVNLAGLKDCSTITDDTYYHLNTAWGVSTKNDQNYYLVGNNGEWFWSDASTDLTEINITALEGVLGTDKLGPADPQSWLNHYEIGNLGYDAKYDPLCDDSGVVISSLTNTSGANASVNGQCDCIDDDGDNQCTLVDTFTEPTLSDLPYWPGDPSAEGIKLILKWCGGDSSADLNTCVNDLLVAGMDDDPFSGQTYNRDATVDIKNVHLDHKVFECADDITKTVKWIDTWAVIDNSSDAYIAMGCGDTSNDVGPVRLKKLVKRKNAFDFGKPNKILRLISSATATVGTGASIDPTVQVFNFQEALALIYLRLAFPVSGQIDFNGEDLGQQRLYFEQIRSPVSNNGLSSGILRAFLKKGGFIP